jgi:hypothetical protein
MLPRKGSVQKVDLVSVFAGDQGRVDQGIMLAEGGYGSHLSISFLADFRETSRRSWVSGILGV